MSFQLVTRTGHPTFLDFPWREPLAAWESDRLVSVVRGIGRHVVRFVEIDGVLYALKELPEELAEREFRLLTALRDEEMPVVEPVGVVVQRPDELDAVLITRHLEFSLPYRALFGGRGFSDLRDRLLDSLAQLLVRLHLGGFFWGDCSLSNALFRRDAGALQAYLVDAETGELHRTLSPGQRRHDLEIAEQNLHGELLDVEAEIGRLPSGIAPEVTAAEVRRRYDALWEELTREEVFAPGERYRIDERLRRLNELGYDVDAVELVGSGEEFRLRLDPRVVEPGHHRRRLAGITGLDVQENQARRLLQDIDAYRRHTGAAEQVVGYRWLREIFEPTIERAPAALRGKLEPAEMFHEILVHRWYLSEARGSDVGIEEAAKSYVETVLAEAPEERLLLLDDDQVQPPSNG
jgi:tRNA A-37 threonylcarbamoyl transferase component Bud32